MLASDGQSLMYIDCNIHDQPRGDVLQYTAGTTGQPKGVMWPLSGLQIDDPAAVGVSMLERMLLGMAEAT